MYNKATTASHGQPKAASSSLHIATKESMFDITNDGIGTVSSECVVAVSQLEDCSMTKANANASITAL